MVSYIQAGKMLDELMEALPEGIFDRLNGGVNFLEEAKESEKGGYILGLYHHNGMGRYIELFYGSFVGLYGNIPPAQFKLRLRSTLHHELTHHIESLAGDRSLERWDEDQDHIWEDIAETPFTTGSILFCDDDDAALAPAAKALFLKFAADRCPDILCESAGIFDRGGELQPDCRRAAEALGADFTGHSFKKLDQYLFDNYDTVICMTLAQMDELLDRYPASEAKVLCIDDGDILRPKFRMGWKKCVERLHAAAEDISDQLRAEECIDYEIIPMTGEHISAVAELERENFSVPFDEAMLGRYLEKPDCCFWVANESGRVLGYIGGRMVAGELEIFNVAVDSTQRRRHIGQALAEELIGRARLGGLERISLEVRAGNAAAIALYEKLGFTRVGRRKNYYEKPREDAILMDLDLQ